MYFFMLSVIMLNVVILSVVAPGPNPIFFSQWKRRDSNPGSYDYVTQPKVVDKTSYANHKLILRQSVNCES